MRTETKTTVKTNPYTQYEVIAFSLAELPKEKCLKLVNTLQEVKNSNDNEEDKNCQIEDTIFEFAMDHSDFYYCDECQKFFRKEDFDVEHGKCFKCQMDYLDEDEQEKLLTEATKAVQ